MLERLVRFESQLLSYLQGNQYTNQFIHDKISGRITLYLILVGIIAFLNELYISIDMIFIQKQTYNELNVGSITEGLKLQNILVNDPTYHSTEYMNEIDGIIIEEFEAWDKFCVKPVHVSQIFVDCDVIRDGQSLLSERIQYHIEFLPEDFCEEKRVEFGGSLYLLRMKLYHLFKDSDLYNEFVVNDGLNEFSISENVEIYNNRNELLPSKYDKIQLCFLKIETNNTIRCNFIL
ncbi:ergosterol biosynthesis protein 29 [Monosporozyma servazzii]